MIFFPYLSTMSHFWPVRRFLKDSPQDLFYSHRMVRRVSVTEDLKYSMFEKDSDLIALFEIENIVKLL